MLESVIIETNKPITHSIIWLHGLGADGNDFAGIVRELNLANDAAIRFIFPHAPVRPVTINGHIPMRAWYDIYSLTDLNHEDKSGITTSQQEIELLIQHENTQGIPTNKIILAGFSQGGAIALHTGLRCPEKLAGILGLSCYLPALNTFAKEANLANKKTPIFLSHGLQDPVLPYKLGEHTRDFLQQHQYSVEWHSYPIGHEVCLDEINDINAWLRSCTK